MTIWTLATKELRLLVRDRRALVLLLAMPLVFILVLGLSLGSTYGQKPDERLRVTVVNLDQGDRYRLHRLAANVVALPPLPHGGVSGVIGSPLAAAVPALACQLPQFPYDVPRESADGVPYASWAELVLDDLADTAGIRVEVLHSLEEAEKLVRNSERSAILVFGSGFSDRAEQCSFLVDGINPFHRDGVALEKLDARVLRDETQRAAASIIEQVAQVSLLRVILPYMIGKAFERLSDDEFIELMGKKVELPVPAELARLPGALALLRSAGILERGREKIPLAKFMVGPQGRSYRRAVGEGVQEALRAQFENYELTGKTWAKLTRSRNGAAAEPPAPPPQSIRYQLLVPANTVMFAFFLVLTAGWLLVSDRRTGTLKRLRAAPISRTQLLMGKLVPFLAFSVFQGLFLLAAGKLLFGMSWGPAPWWLAAVVVCTSFAATGLALLVAALARSETQVATYGTLLVMVLAGISGCMMPRNLMPEDMKLISRATPHAWALDAYSQLLLSPTPNLWLVGQACVVLIGFGIGLTAAAWVLFRLE